MQRIRPKRSTNPFDDDDAGDDDMEAQGDVYYDVQQDEIQRLANLNFDNPFDGVEDPVLKFDQTQNMSTEFISPLESVMEQFETRQIGSPAKDTGYSTFASYHQSKATWNQQFFEDDDEITEESALLRSSIASSSKQQRSGLTTSPGRSPGRHRIPTEISTGGPVLTPQRRRQPAAARRKSSQPNKNTVLTELASGENEFSMDYKYILLEDLGTASSWLILLLPYVAFLLALLLESSESLKTTTLGPLIGNQTCPINSLTGKANPIHQAPTVPCHSPFKGKPEEYMYYRTIQNKNKTSACTGVMFDSGVLPSIPVLSTYLYGDVVFRNLTSKTVAMVSQGLVETSIVVFQRQPMEHSKADGSGWSLVHATSTPHTLTMACQRTSGDSALWDCKSPRIMNVAFSMPDSAAYAAGNLRFNICFSLKMPGLDSTTGELYAKNDSTYSLRIEFETSRVYTKSKNDSVALSSTDFADPLLRLEKLVSSSEYTLEHMSKTGMQVDTGVRLSTFLISFWFVFYWCYSMGVHKLCTCCSKGKKEVDYHWWESPWILFPERWYIILLLVSLLLLQEPLLAVMSFYPSLGANTRLHVAADATIGMGVQGILFVYLCLFRGLPLHTAAIAKRRTEHQRQVLELRRAAKYVAKTGDPYSQTEEGISEYIRDYYQRFGDVDGSSSPALLRLQHDPCSDGCADFLFFKLLLLLIGVASVIGTAYCRFPPDEDDVLALSDSITHRYKLMYIACATVQFLSLLVWMSLIIAAAFGTGQKLRRQPFLGTRPVQLAYRILFAHVSLGLIVLTVAFAVNISKILRKWSLSNPVHPELMFDDTEDTTHVELMIRVLATVAQQFPYSGTAASVGSGKVLFATVSIIITAFIFFRAHILDEENDDRYVETWGTTRTNLNDKLHRQRRLRRDKRLVVNLARDSKTWRVFPLAIKQSSVSTTVLQDDVFQLYKDLYTDGNTKDRGVVSVGPYTPVFCLELACWLNEASWQAYYAPAGITPNNRGITGMNLEGLGLRLEGALYDEATDTQAYVATNVADQVDGEEDAIIVVAFRGSTSSTNLHTDLRSRQVPLFDQLTGIGSAPFCIFPDRVDVYDDDGWIWDTLEPHRKESVQCVTSWTSAKPSCVPSSHVREEEPSKLAAVSRGARKILQATPVARDSFPLVHEGFQEVYTHIRHKLLDILFPVIQRQLEAAITCGSSNGDREPLALPKIYCTGHSLGGSLAQLLALDLANNCELIIPTKLNNELEHFCDEGSGGKDSKAPKSAEKEIRLQPPIAVYTFGQPRVGNKAFSRLYKQRVPHTFRVVNEGDAITSMPNYFFCGGIYKHSGLEVLLDEGLTGNILVGPTVVETLFRFHQMRTSVVAHTMQRYRDCLECAFAQDELLEYYRGHNLIVKSMNSRQEEFVAPADIPEWMTQSRVHA